MLYYKDLSVARRFYGDILGLQKTMEDSWVTIYRSSPSSFIGIVKGGAKGAYHHAQDRNAVMITIVTDNLEAWHDQLKRAKGVTFLKEIYEGVHTPVRAFLVEDPGGYSVEFVQWR
jgi:extradiol dioxygenase family protein